MPVAFCNGMMCVDLPNGPWNVEEEIEQEVERYQLANLISDVTDIRIVFLFKNKTSTSRLMVIRAHGHTSHKVHYYSWVVDPVNLIKL